MSPSSGKITRNATFSFGFNREIPLVTSFCNSVRDSIVSVSTRAFVGTGQDILIPGVVVGADSPVAANAPRPLLVRAVGPGLADFGVNGTLARPLVRVLRANGTVIAENIGWQAAANREAVVTASTRVGAFPLASNRADSALLLALEAAAYTIQVSGAEGGSGIVLVEVYEVP